MFFRSQVKIHELRKRVLSLECDTQRLMMTERWRELRQSMGLPGLHSKDSLTGWRKWSVLVAPVGAFVLSRWIRSKGGGQENSFKQGNSYRWGLISDFFDWMERFQRP
jgi:hypothetical protein